MAIARVYVPTISNTYQLQQQINTALENLYDDADAHQGTVTKVDTGTGLTGGPITSTGTVALADTKVTPGAYTLASVTVDQQGRITAASTGAAVTKIDAGTGLTGGSITSTGTVAIDEAASLHWTGVQTLDKPVTPGLTFATLPATPTQGQRSFITDCNSTTFLAAAAGGGSNKVPVTFDGTNWVIG